MTLLAAWTKEWERTDSLARDICSLFRLHGCTETARHSVLVAQEAERLAIRFGVDRQAAVTAGLLHDSSAIFPNSQRIEVARLAGVDVLPEEEQFPMIVHQKLSVVIARELFAVSDADILSAIGCHTTLKTGAKPLDLVLFVADKIKWDQPGTPPYLQPLLAALDDSLECAALVYLAYLWERRDKLRVVHPWLRDAYLELSERAAKPKMPPD
ncbi:bis(5'-nucleosyl)-tetraphosphatase (symmetrical) YqeK [Brevibacillus agri]|uniref:bis(5'-nucleosyl)-tetraphosphatase (symmetrical) YqeK n=1 Tax=Brevibacillus agri TaxID=51101 RepID=UPI003D1A0455